MTRDEFIRSVAERQGNSIMETRYWVDIIFEELKRAILEEENVSIYGFGTFSHRRQKSRRAADFNAKEYTYEDGVNLKFTPSIYLRNAVKDRLTWKEFEQRMARIRALKRGEYVPGYRQAGGRLYPLEDPNKKD